MEVKTILICESASHHPDGTFSLLRGGIDNWNIKSFPSQIGFTFVIMLELLSAEAGMQHTAELDVIDADGHKILPQAKINFKIGVKENTSRYKFNLIGGVPKIPITKPGKYSFNFSVDGNFLASTEFQAVQSPQ